MKKGYFDQRSYTLRLLQCSLVKCKWSWIRTCNSNSLVIKGVAELLACHCLFENFILLQRVFCQDCTITLKKEARNIVNKDLKKNRNCRYKCLHVIYANWRSFSYGTGFWFNKYCRMIKLISNTRGQKDVALFHLLLKSENPNGLEMWKLTSKFIQTNANIIYKLSTLRNILIHLNVNAW